jgi:hypothetical protein
MTGTRIRRPAGVDTTAASRRGQLRMDRDTQSLNLAPRIALLTALAALGAVFWLGVWKAVELTVG